MPPDRFDLVERGSLRRPLRFADCELIVRKSATRLNDLPIEFSTPNGKDAQSRDLPVTLRRDSDHPLLCPLLWFFVLAHRAGAMDQWPFTVPQLFSPVVFANTASDYVRFRFRGDRAVCWSTR